MNLFNLRSEIWSGKWMTRHIHRKWLLFVWCSFHCRIKTCILHTTCVDVMVYNKGKSHTNEQLRWRLFCRHCPIFSHFGSGFSLFFLSFYGWLWWLVLHACKEYKSDITYTIHGIAWITMRQVDFWIKCQTNAKRKKHNTNKHHCYYFLDGIFYCSCIYHWMEKHFPVFFLLLLSPCKWERWSAK